MQKERWYLSGAALLLVTAVTAVYVPGLHGPYVFDDLTNILQVAGIRITDLQFDSLRQAWQARDFDTFIGRPIAMLSFALNYYFAEFDVFYFKLTNLIIHIVTAAALFWLTLSLLRRHRLINPNCPYRQAHLPWLALAIAGVWVLHPLNLTSVLYVVQRMTSLGSLFIVLGLIGYCHGREQIVRGSKAGLATILVSLVLFGSLSMLCKENGVLLLPFAAVVELAFYRFAAHSRLVPLFRRFWLTIVLLPMILGLAVLLVQHDRWFGEFAYHRRDFTLGERLLTEARALWFYLRLIFLPAIAKMGLYHDDFPLSRGLTEPVSTLFSLIGIVGLIVAAAVARVRAPVLFFAIAWFLVGHSMESSILPLELIHEHRNYLPQYGMLFGAVYFVAGPYSHKGLGRTLRLRLGFLALYAVLLGVGTYSRSHQWRDEMTLYTQEIMNHPKSARSHTMLGALLHLEGFRKQAREHFTIATNLTPHQAEHLIRLVQNVYMTTGQIPDELFEELRYRLEHNRVSGATIWVYEPLLLVTRKNPQLHDQIIELYAMLISRPDIHFGALWYEVANRLLAENHLYRGRARVAISYYEKARAINPRPFYDVTLAKLYAENGCYNKTRGLVTSLRARQPSLEPSDETHLQEVETLLARGDGANARCKL